MCHFWALKVCWPSEIKNSAQSLKIQVEVNICTFTITARRSTLIEAKANENFHKLSDYDLEKRILFANESSVTCLVALMQSGIPLLDRQNRDVRWLDIEQIFGV